MRAPTQDKAETAKGVVLPEWLPPAVAAQVKWGLERPESVPGKHSALIRLATDECMESVWRELTQHMPIGDIRREKGDDPELSDHEVVLGHVFRKTQWHTCMTLIFASLRPQEQEWIKSCDQQANRLRREAALLQKRGGVLDDVGPSEHVEAVMRAAAWCETLRDAPKNLKLAGAIVRHDHGTGYERGFCRKLAQEFIELYGKQLRGSVAKIASVALNKKVTIANVRDWTRDMRNPGL